tara:strand:- start:1180 stop:1746 length:567 start_codon:yes stop_codon:yes gene_type:complete
MLMKYIKYMLMILLFTGFVFSSDEVASAKVEKAEILPGVTLKDLSNKKVDIYSFLDSGPMLINFWFLACEPCKKEMKFLDEFDQKYEKYGFNVVSINTDNSRAFSQVKPFVKSKKYSFDVLSDSRSKYFRKLGGTVCPFTVIVDTSGAIISKHVGYNSGDEKHLEESIIKLLNIPDSDSSDVEEIDVD